jgi:catechol 2,3-dioxygenase-like lactoylglutathione lyase family enzyme
MEAFVAVKLDEFAKGKISRRQLLETLTVAATTTAAATGSAAAAAGPDPAIKPALVNHISYTCPDFKKAADWYGKVLNLEMIGPTDHDVAGVFGKRGTKPMGVTANDVPLSYIIFRTRAEAPPQPGAAPRRKSQAVVEHMGYTVADFDREKAKVELKRLGVEAVRDGGLYSLHMLDPFGYDVQLSGVANNALSDGA